MRKLTITTILLAGAAFATPAMATPCLAVGSLSPPPCMIIDPSKILEHANKIKQYRDRITELSQVAENLADISSIMGEKAESKGKPVKAWVPLAPGEEISFAQAANEMAAIMPESDTLTADQTDAQRAAMIIAERASSGDGWSLAQSTKERLVGMKNDGDILAKATGQCSTNLRRDVQLNTHAKLLYMRSLMALRELRQGKALYGAISTINYEPTEHIPTHDRESAPEYLPERGTDFASILTDIALNTARLLALKNGNEAAAVFATALSDLLQTKREYDTLAQIADQTNQTLVNLAAATASEKNVDAQALVLAANETMAKYDQSTWDTPDKDAITARATALTKQVLDSMVDGNVSDQWITVLTARAEAYKQAAFFKDYAASADDYIKSTQTAQSAYSDGLGVDLQDKTALNTQIADLQKQIDDLKASLATAPPDVQKKAANILQQLNVASGAVSPLTTPTGAANPVPASTTPTT